MQFKTDENLPLDAADLLRGAGHDVATIMDQRLVGAADSDIARVCLHEQRILLTLDTDFADIRTYPPADYAGLIVLRLRQQDKLNVLAAVHRLLSLLSTEPVCGHLWIVEENRVRIRE